MHSIAVACSGGAALRPQVLHCLRAAWIGARPAPYSAQARQGLTWPTGRRVMQAQASNAATAEAAHRPGSGDSSPAAAPTKLVLVVGIALIRPGSKSSSGVGGTAQGQKSEPTVLLAQRPPGKANEGLWEFPGGKVEPGETPERALVRELHEELGIEIHEADLKPLSFASHAYPTFHLLMPLYSCTSWRGEPTGAEGQAVVWATEAQVLAGVGEHAQSVPNYPLTPADIPLVPDVVRALQSCV